MADRPTFVLEYHGRCGIAIALSFMASSGYFIWLA